MNNKVIAGLCLLAALLLNLSGDGGGLLPVAPDRSPVPGSGLHVLIVEDRLKRQELPPLQFDAMMSSDVDELIREHDGRKYLYDQNQDVSNKDDPWVKDAMKVPRDTVPWLVLDYDGRGTAQKFPAEPREFKELLQSYLKK